MRWTLFFALICLVSCASPPPAAVKKVEPAPEAVGAQKAFFRTYPSARAWAPDVLVMRVESVAIPEVPPNGGKFGAWRITYVSPAKMRLKVFTFSVAESPGNVYKDVFSPLEERWNGPGGSTEAFRMEAFKIESDKAYQTAAEKSAAFLAKKSTKPMNVVVEWNKRFSQPSYRFYWGDSIGMAEYSAFVDTVTGQFLTKVP